MHLNSFQIELRKNRGGLWSKEESRPGSLSDGGKQQFTKDRRQLSRDSGQKVTCIQLNLKHVSYIFCTVVLFTGLFTHGGGKYAIITKEMYFPFL